MPIGYNISKVLILPFSTLELTKKGVINARKLVGNR